jgi:TetR/AcrR family transcriptional regulator
MSRERLRRHRHESKRDPERTKAQILEAATALFTRCGLNGASLDDISKEAGVNRGLIYHYFRTKESLFDHVLARPLAHYIQSQLELLQREIDAVTLQDATAAFFRFLGRHPELVRLLAWTIAMRRVALELSQLELTRALFLSAIRRIDEAKAAGRIRPDLDSAHLLISVIDLCVSWHMGCQEWAHKLNWADRDLEDLNEERLAAILDLIDAAVKPRPALLT